jgi:hypothetical protein
MAGIKGEPEVISKEEELSVLGLLSGKLSGGIPDIFPHIKLKYMLSH